MHATAAIRSVREAYPQAHNALTSTTASDILRTNRDITVAG